MTHFRKLLSVAILSVGLIAAAACSTPSPAPTPIPTAPIPTPTSPAAVADSLALAFITAEESKQAADYLDLFWDDAIYMDNSNATSRQLGGEYMRNSHSIVIEMFKHENYAMKWNSHFVSADGRFIALSGTYTNTGKDGNPASVPIAVILEVKDGKLIREDVYYDPSPFY